jgi:hypothetical protein
LVQHLKVLKANFHGGLIMVLKKYGYITRQIASKLVFGVEPGITLQGFNLIALLVNVDLFTVACFVKVLPTGGTIRKVAGCNQGGLHNASLLHCHPRERTWTCLLRSNMLGIPHSWSAS